MYLLIRVYIWFSFFFFIVTKWKHNKYSEKEKDIESHTEQTKKNRRIKRKESDYIVKFAVFFCCCCCLCALIKWKWQSTLSHSKFIKKRIKKKTLVGWLAYCFTTSFIFFLNFFKFILFAWLCHLLVLNLWAHFRSVIFLHFFVRPDYIVVIPQTDNRMYFVLNKKKKKIDTRNNTQL